MRTLVTLRRRLAADLTAATWVDLLLAFLDRADRARKARRSVALVREGLSRGAVRSACYWLGSIAGELDRSGRRDEAFVARLLADVVGLRSIRPGGRRYSALATPYRQALARRIDDFKPARPGRKTR